MRRLRRGGSAWWLRALVASGGVAALLHANTNTEGGCWFTLFGREGSGRLSFRSVAPGVF